LISGGNYLGGEKQMQDFWVISIELRIETEEKNSGV
jgi:hypothetical protein